MTARTLRQCTSDPLVAFVYCVLRKAPGEVVDYAVDRAERVSRLGVQRMLNLDRAEQAAAIVERLRGVAKPDPTVLNFPLHYPVGVLLKTPEGRMQLAGAWTSLLRAQLGETARGKWSIIAGTGVFSVRAMGEGRSIRMREGEAPEDYSVRVVREALDFIARRTPGMPKPRPRDAFEGLGTRLRENLLCIGLPFNFILHTVSGREEIRVLARMENLQVVESSSPELMRVLRLPGESDTGFTNRAYREIFSFCRNAAKFREECPTPEGYIWAVTPTSVFGGPELVICQWRYLSGPLAPPTLKLIARVPGQKQTRFTGFAAEYPPMRVVVPAGYPLLLEHLRQQGLRDFLEVEFNFPRSQARCKYLAQQFLAGRDVHSASATALAVLGARRELRWSTPKEEPIPTPDTGSETPMPTFSDCLHPMTNLRRLVNLINNPRPQFFATKMMVTVEEGASGDRYTAWEVSADGIKAHYVAAGSARFVWDALLEHSNLPKDQWPTAPSTL